jgi:hypothetical protein
MKVEFIPSNKFVDISVDKPVSSKMSIPSWYKNVKNTNDISKKNVKMCMPFLDAFCSGYIQHTWCDIYISNNNGEISYKSSSDIVKIIDHRDEVNTKITQEYYPIEFIWLTPWIAKLPRGYSMLYTHPLNRNDLPFHTLSAVVDCDEYYFTMFGNYPFYVKNNFSGIIPAGTPMFQMIPIKRENWDMSFEKWNEEKATKRVSIIKKNFLGVYKNKYWKKKSYN